MSNFLHWFITIIAVGSFLACVALIVLTSRRKPGEAKMGEVTGHTWDDDLAEYNNPLPRWWLWLFYITIVFGLAYMFLYPALGNNEGKLKWSQAAQYEKEMARAKEKYGKIFAAYAKIPIPELANNKQAMATARRLFLNNCAACHGSDGGGAPGFPSLKDKDWLYGGSPKTIKASITNGRSGNMPPMGAAVGGKQGVEQVAHYVKSLSGGKHDAKLAALGKAKFVVCASCHGMNGKGNKDIGAPNLTDNIWLYGGDLETIKQTITKGRNGHMPAHKDLLGADKIHLLAAYVYSLSRK